MMELPYNTSECCQTSFRENPEALVCESCHCTWELVNDGHRKTAKEWVKKNWVRDGSNVEQFVFIEIFAHGLALGEAKERIRKDEQIRKWAHTLFVGAPSLHSAGVHDEMVHMYRHGKTG